MGKEYFLTPDEEFLQKIAQIESSGGKNLNHREIASGIHEGDRAIGPYGLMPNTIEEVLNRDKLNKTKNPDLKDYYDMPKEDYNSNLNENFSAQDKIAKELAQRVLQKSGNDEDKAAYMWNQGHNKDPNQITPEMLDNAQYVQKFRNLKNLLNRR